MTVFVRIAKEAFDPDAESRSFRAQHSGAGAVVTFVGQVRGENGVTSLALEHYAEMTEREIARIAELAASQFQLLGLCVIHRVGVLSPGDPIVLVSAAAAHRRPAFDAAERMMDYLKSEAPFWKNEIAQGRKRWIEPSGQDGNDAARWKI
jgi:molybdopterin synthase catalytic subunit